jgi:hypothetical protein
MKRQRISQNEKVILCAAIRAREGRIMLDDLLEECVQRFPEEFSYRETKYPDTGKVEKRAWSCRTDKGWLAGSPSDGYYVLTSAGIVAAKRCAEKLNIPLPEAQLHFALDKERVERVRKSRAFQAFMKNRPIQQHLVAIALGLPPEATKRQIKFALRELKGEAQLRQSMPILRFIAFCEKQLNLRGTPGS